MPEYWIVDVNARRVEVYDSLTSNRYERMRHFAAGTAIAPGAFPEALLSIDKLFT